MADEKRSGSKGIPHHPLVAALASDPSKPPEKATKLFGYPGPAAEKGSIRLWLDIDLTTYVDVPDEAILHSQTLPDDQGTYLWVDPTATLTYSSTQSHEVQAEFLGGSIAARNLAAAAPVGGIGGGGLNTTATTCQESLGTGCTILDNCNETGLPNCPSAFEPVCGVVGTAATVCTRFPECPVVSAPTNCPTVYPRCRVSLATQCPTVRPVQCQIHSRVEVCPTPTVVEPFVSGVVRCPTPPEICRPYVSQAGACHSIREVCLPTANAAGCVTQASLCDCPQISWNRCPTIGGCITINCGATWDCGIVGPFRPQEQ
jgi:hypothetical protein